MVTLISALVLQACSDTSDNETSGHSDEKKAVKLPPKISKIEITQFGEKNILLMKYNGNVVNIEMQPARTNIDARIEFNDNDQIREIIAGSNRIQYLYDDQNRRFGIVSGNAQQQIMFKHENGLITHQYTIRGNDTIGKFRYTYENGIPITVDIVGAYPYYRKYKLEYSDVDNALSGFNELILPADIITLLGIPAVYGKKYLIKATRIDSEAASDVPLQENYSPPMKEVRFEITKAGKQETLNLVSDGTRQWSATIQW